jgi:hypothetical protein
VSTVAEKDGRVASWRRTIGTLTMMWSNRSKELIVMGRRTRKLSVQRFTFAMATKGSLAKASIDPGCTYLLASEDSKVMGTDRDENEMEDFSMLTFREP